MRVPTLVGLKEHGDLSPFLVIHRLIKNVCVGPFRILIKYDILHNMWWHTVHWIL